MSARSSDIDSSPPPRRHRSRFAPLPHRRAGGRARFAPLVPLAVVLAVLTPAAARAASGSDLPPPPPLVDPDGGTPTPGLAKAADGLYHVVVRPTALTPAGRAQPTAPGFPGRPSAASLVAGAAATDTAATDSPSTGTPSTGTPAGPAADDPAPVIVDDLSRVPGVVAVTPIGDGSFAVATTSPHTVSVASPGGSPVQVTPDPILRFADTGSDPFRPYQWALDNNGTNLASSADPPPRQVTNADLDGREAAVAVQAQGQDVVVAVVDSGVDFTHPDLQGHAWKNPGEVCGNNLDDDGDGLVDDCRGWSFGYDDNQSYRRTNSPHGTHVAGIIAATAGNGVGIAGLASQAKIMDLSLSAPGGMTASSAARAIRYAVDHGARVVNLSLGTQPGTPAAWVTPLVDAIHYAEAARVLVVAAAGNSGVDLGTTPIWPASIDSSNLLVVGASGPADTAAEFSDYGLKVDLFAPGEWIVSTVPGGYAFMSGTSQASPMAAAVAADVLSHEPRLTPPEVIGRLIGTADYIPALKAKVPGGARLNAARALGIVPGNGS